MSAFVNSARRQGPRCVEPLHGTIAVRPPSGRSLNPVRDLDPPTRRQVARLTSTLSSHRRTRSTLEVRETNLPAQLFFRSQGFQAVRVLRGFYEDSGEDAFLMPSRLIDDVGAEVEESVNRIAQFEES